MVVTMDAAKTIEILKDSFLPGDLNTDGEVDIIDLNMVLIDWGKIAPGTPGAFDYSAFSDERSDADGSGEVDIVDLNTVLIDWGK